MGHLGRGMNCDPSDVSEALESLLPTSVYFTRLNLFVDQI